MLKKSVYISGSILILFALACGFAKDYNFRNIYYSHNELYKYARQPNGLPKGIDLNNLDTLLEN